MVRFAFFLFMLSAVAARSGPLDGFAGTYRGCAVSGGEWVPIETTLAVSGDSLSGTYIFIEPSGRNVPGNISVDDHDGEDRLTLRWHDLYGEGPAVFEFSSDRARFHGFWTVDANDRRFDWNGVRTDSNLAIPDCRIPVS